MLQAGYAQLDISPDSDCSLFGYDYRETDLAPGNDGVHDPLYARALVLKEDVNAEPAVMISTDLCVIPDDLARIMRQAVADRVKTDVGRVMLSAIHTHSGPYPMTREWAIERGRMADDDPPTPDVRYAEGLIERIVEVAARANGFSYPSRVSVREAPLGIGYDRRVRAEEGIMHYWAPQRHLDPRPMLAPDPTCTLVSIEQATGPRHYLLWSLGAHPVVLGQASKVVSADYPGRACQLIEEWVPGSRAMFFLGAAGHTHPWIATQEDPANVEPVARAAASFVSLLSYATYPVQADDKASIRIASARVPLGPYELDLTVWRVGELWIAGAPVELFGELAADLRQRLGGPLLLATLTNGWNGYWPTREAFPDGTYEVDIAVHRGLEPGDGEKLIDALVDLADSIRP